MAETTTKILTQKPSEIIRKQFRINGIVQGVGFRPFIYNLANKFNLTGTVSNSSEGVIIEAQGTSANVHNFINVIQTDAPPLSMISALETNDIPNKDETSFIIKTSEKSSTISTMISPDVAVCDDCLDELFNPKDRRFLYPFINCTNCGPRYTIIENIPYDRPFTSMRHFELCTNCQEEYDDPNNRRFHAQPNACSDCGPKVQLHDGSGKPVRSDNPIRDTVELIKQGKIAAIKGLGGFHLAVDATNSEAVKTLRKRKGRKEKPLAIMLKSMEDAKSVCHINRDEANELRSFQSPIVLLKKREDIPIANDIAPGNDRIGIMLPYTPLHHLLFYDDAPSLVMTSANLSEEPICIENNEAVNRLLNIADIFLVHNRKILTRTDDSVLMFHNKKRSFLRRSRGFVPMPIQLPFSVPSVLALGAFLKNTICVTRGNQAFLSQHIGDLDNALACRFFDETIKYVLDIHQIKPQAVIHDYHPDFYSTKAIERFTLPAIQVQHHHAHLAATMAEHHLKGPVLGLALDGFGLSEKNEFWGGELLLVDDTSYRRLGHFYPLPHLGGDSASHQSWRMGAAVLHSIGKENRIPSFFPSIPNIDKIMELLKTPNLFSFTTGCGRWFDAAAAILGISTVQKYEGQAPTLLESLVTKPEILEKGWRIKNNILDFRPLMEYLLNCDPVSGANIFHGTLAAGLADWVKRAGLEHGIKTVISGGGCFHNKVLVELLDDHVRKIGFHSYFPEQIPPGDGGISLGQAWVGALKLMEQS
ncbi:MAG TPA: carbamoyltransferase HypF [Candidatus Marinimicrobia bacterium]|jgi:hydrogenase maturation protein HypF|nr:carbamoyltransferase HypF [Candidatus Neomarinimicrobiota bacterium]MDP6033204.1 carbamoyltransferase HypF [Candidatus Neomarinimicrobiota bacterium]MDP7216722.1 carbamoyltransferase HypF [Candidatus Neomarinimicrobiota bacterium]MDP7565859.1 carbamoyltransferase HypF [Candidatus Neomarinimicrobiota bacterium]HJL75628.1 carbamoyltransferase HypF [Candidatus Neomarinimicrobiota bacterium]|tara:strand:- start:10105 stop:12381 length:2277 start_codon:yes stop_codon:yes gene_type:complete